MCDMNKQKIMNRAEKCMYTMPLPIATLLILTLCPCYKNKRMQTLSHTTLVEPYSY